MGEETTYAVYFYGSTNFRAAAAGAEDVTSQINTYRYDTTRFAGVATQASAVVSGDGIKSITYNDIADRLKGEEVSNVTQNYNSLNAITSTAVYFYASGTEMVRAASASSEALNTQVNTYRLKTAYRRVQHLTNIKSITYNRTSGLEKGEEITNYAVNYNGVGEETTYAVYFYGSTNFRAAGAGAEDVTSQINTYRYDTTRFAGVATQASAVVSGDGIKSITYNDIAGRLKGEEVSNVTQNYNSLGAITSTAVYFYASGTEMVRGLGLLGGPEHPGQHLPPENGLTAEYNTFTNIKSITYNRTSGLEKGEEITNYAVNYNGVGEETTYAVYFYGSTNLRSRRAGADDVTSQINTYRYDTTRFAGVATQASAVVSGDGIKSITYNDIADRLERRRGLERHPELQLAGRDHLDGGLLLRLGHRDRQSRLGLLGGPEHPGQHLPPENGLTAEYNTFTNIKSITYNRTSGLEKGEEISNYAVNYNGVGEETTYAVYFYGSTNLRAAAAGAEDVTSQINTYRYDTTRFAGVATQASAVVSGDGIKSITYNDIAGRLKGEEVSNDTQNYNSLGAVTSTAVYFYARAPRSS